jgi:basic membrane protein A and related proteins
MVAKLMRLVAGVAGLALVAAGCGTAPEKDKDGGTGAGASNFSACMVTDTGGIDDRSFNAASWAGMQAAGNSSGAKVQYVASTSENDYVPNITRLISQKCSLVLSVGGLMAKATGEAAKANASQKFAIVDSGSVPPNIYGMEFNTAQSSFQAGYLAAAMSKSGKVATFGGLPIPPVTIFMDGFYEGVQYYNKQKNKKVKVLGWDEAKPKSGSMANSFTDQGAGKRIASNFIQQGADIIFPVAGGVGLGAAKAVQTADQSGANVNMMWVDTDGCVSAAQYCKYFITSVTKGIVSAVKNAVLNAAHGTFTGGNYIGTLANDGVGLSPYHDFASKVPASLQSELATIKTQIENGTIKPATKSPI